MRTQSEQTKHEPSEPIASPGRWPLTTAGAPIRTSLRRGLLAAAAIAVIIAALVGWALRAASTSQPPPPVAQPLSAKAGPVAVTVDGAWATARSVPGVSGLDPKATAAFTPASGLRAYAFVTLAPVGDTSLLPAPVRALMPDTLPKPRPTELLGMPAWHYTEQQIAGDRTIEVTVVPSTAGVLAVACIAPRESWVAALGCAGGVRQLSLRDGAWLEPGPDLAAQARLPATVAALDARRVPLRKQLQAANTRGAQARFARRLSRAYAAAAATLAPVTRAKSPADNVVNALRGTAAAQGKMSAAAAAGQPKRYRNAKRAVKRGDAALKRALARAE